MAALPVGSRAARVPVTMGLVDTEFTLGRASLFWRTVFVIRVGARVVTVDCVLKREPFAAARGGSCRRTGT